MISKMKIGGKKLGAVTKNTIDKLGSSDRQSENYNRQSGDGSGSPVPQQYAYSPGQRQSGSQRASLESAEPQPSPAGYEGAAVGLGLSGPSRPYATENVSQSPASFTSFAQAQAAGQNRISPSYPPFAGEQRPHTPMSPGPGPVISKKESRHGLSASIGVGKFVNNKPETSTTRHSDTPGYSPPQVSTSPKQKSKFSKFIGDLSQSSITGIKPSAQHAQSPSTSLVGRPPPPPDKTQFRAVSGGSAFDGYDVTTVLS
jgi:hypothetical protein